MTQGAAVGLTLTLWAIAIAIADFRKRQVPNLLLLFVVIPVLLIQFFYGSGILHRSWPDALAGTGIGFLLTGLGYAIRQVGSGDVKYAALLGFIVGRHAILEILLLSALVIGLLSLAALIKSKWQRASPRKVPAAVALSFAFVAYVWGG